MLKRPKSLKIIYDGCRPQFGCLCFVDNKGHMDN